MEHIRPVKLEDAPAIVKLLAQLDYPNTESFIENKLQKMIDDPNEEFFVYEVENRVLAFMSLHFIPQIALQGDFARISYFAVDSMSRSEGIGRMMEEYCTQIAVSRGCDRIELHSHTRREQAHKFYFRQGYEDSPKYLMKKLNI